MANSKRFIADQVKDRLKGSRADVTSVPNEAIYAAIGQHAATLIRQTHFAETLGGGETVPDNTALATYVLPVTEYRNGVLSKTTLPVLPVSLRRMQGIRAVRAVGVNGEIREYDKFIPCPGDTFETTETHHLLSKAGGKVPFKQEAFDLIFRHNLVEEGYPKVEVKLLGVDVNKYDIWSPLPLTAEQEAELIERLVEIFGGKRLPANPSVDVLNEK